MNENSNKYPLILSFDVGIVHLSYCLLTKNIFSDNKLDWDIIEWNNIDLTNRNNEKCYCGSKAFFTNNINNKINYYCKNHSKNLNLDIKSFEDYFTKSFDDIKCCHTINTKDNIKVCNKNIKFKLTQQNIINSLEVNNSSQSFCNLHAKNYYKNINKLSKLKNFKTKKTSNLNYDDVKYNLIIELENRYNLLLADYVVIENQPSFKNPRMKSIASTLYDYYLIRGVIDKKNNSNITHVKFISPSNKLKLINLADSKEKEKVKKTEKESKSYKLTKNLGIKYCSNLIQHLSEWNEFFEKHKKKDDLADSFLQGIYFYNTL